MLTAVWMDGKQHSYDKDKRLAYRKSQNFIGMWHKNKLLLMNLSLPLAIKHKYETLRHNDATLWQLGQNNFQVIFNLCRITEQSKFCSIFIEN